MGGCEKSDKNEEEDKAIGQKLTERLLRQRERRRGERGKDGRIDGQEDFCTSCWCKQFKVF